MLLLINHRFFFPLHINLQPIFYFLCHVFFMKLLLNQLPEIVFPTLLLVLFYSCLCKLWGFSWWLHYTLLLSIKHFGYEYWMMHLQAFGLGQLQYWGFIPSFLRIRGKTLFYALVSSVCYHSLHLMQTIIILEQGFKGLMHKLSLLKYGWVSWKEKDYYI